ncbi:uncharacterized protein LOC116345642 isoform X2 [Contarinia nasturtii]|uniref:uncharacterized protein LOC116345642 isoform X2 n=1 Tax=Contarinia nasturtii TaxID=265458 RepID=UPI0012D46F71|nr:uncharacterized protein LOC116345642 isoform X2 [Contarinia nasturtii]
MDLNSMESEENSVDHVDDGNLLEPLSEVSFSEREKSFSTTVTTAKVNAPKSTSITTNTTTNTSSTSTAKDSEISLPDARARVLHLQRVQRGCGSSGSETTKSSSGTKKRNSKSHSHDKDSNEKEEETVSLSLDSLIRRGVMNDIKKAANFKSNFKFAYSDSESDTYESSGERDGSDEPKFGVTSNGNITNGNGMDNDEHAAIVKRKRGRPPLTEEEKSERAAQKEALRLQNRSMQSQVDDFSMAMGHSIFHASSPKKRGRPPKNRYVTFLNSTTQSEQDSHNESTSQLDESANTSEFQPIKKKRGRKPKSYYLELAARANESGASVDGGQNGTDVSNISNEPSPAPTSAPNVPIEWKKRGRKPKFMETYFVKLEQQQQQQQQQQEEEQDDEQQQQQQQQQQQEDQQSPSVSNQIVKKKRGRKPKSYYLQQMMEQANESAPAILQNTSYEDEGLQAAKQTQPMSANTSMDFSIYANKRGRKPKAYYEHLASLKQDPDTNSSIVSQVESIGNAPDTSILSNEPPAKKKRGRKPKSYYWDLQLQQAAENQSTSMSQSNITGDSVPSPNRLSTEYDRQAESSATQSLLPTKPLPKSAIRTYIHRPYVRRIIPQQKIFRRPGHDIPLVGLPFKKKRGRKPKNYQPHLDEQLVESNQSGLMDTSERKQQPQNLQALQERNRVLLDLYEKRGDEIRTYKQRIANLINDKVEQSVDINSLSWTNMELCKAFSLQRLNIPLFNYLRDKFSIPMPSTDDVRKFVNNIQLVRGIQSTMLQILDCDGQIHEDHEKLTILQISYIKTAEIYEYDEQKDLILGPHKYMTLIIARGLYKDWAQVVYFNFDTRVTKQQLNGVIEALHKIDFPVIALSSNFEEEKSDIFADLSINYGKGVFPHPITQEKIHCFYYLDDMLQATNAHFFGGHLTIDDNQQTKQPINKQAVMQAIHKNYRRIPIPRELLAWTDNDINNVDAIHTFFSQFTINLMRISLPIDDRSTKNVTEFISIMKSYSELMNRPQCIDSDVDTVNFDRYMDFQNKRLDKIHARLFKLDYANTTEGTRKKFREAMMMSIVSLKMLRKSVMSKYKNSTFSTEAITNEITRTKLNDLINKYSFKRVMPPTQLFRIIKDIFLGENCSVKIESNVTFFFNGAVTAAEVNGRNETFYVAALIHWICETYAKKYPDSMDIKDLKRKLKKVEETFCTVQNPNFRVCENVVNKITKDLIETNAFDPSLNEFIRLYIIQRHLLRIKYFNENHINRVAMSVQMTINLEE